MPLREDPAILDANLEALSKPDPQLAELLRAAAPWGAVEAARDGAPTLSGPDAQGVPVLLHSRYRPVEEGDQWAEGWIRPLIGCYVVWGVGLGHGLAALLRKAPGATQVFAYEAVPGILRRALSLHDWTGPLRSRRLVPMTGRDKPALFARMEPDTVGLFLGTAVASLPSAERIDPEAYRWARSVLSDFFQHGRMSLLTAATLASITKLNLAANLADYLAWPGVDDLRGAWAGRPALIVSAGPSLGRHYGLLPRIQDRFAVIAVDTVFRTLLSLGVRPDFVTALDYSSIARKYFEGLPPQAQETTLVCDARVNWTVLDEFRGPRRFTHAPYLSALLPEIDLPRASLPGGATVAHLAFHLAEHLGADPIVFVGQDLSYPFGTTHAPGNPIHLHWAAECNPYQTLEMREWEEILRMRARLRKVPGVGGPVYTDDQMFSYLQRFMTLFSRTKSRVWNATEGGAIIEGAEGMTLREALSRLPEAGVPKPWRGGVRADLTEGQRARALEALSARRAELLALEKDVAATHDALRDVRDRFGERGEVKAAITRAREAGRRVQDSRAYRLVSDLAQADEYRRIRRDRIRALMDLEGEARQQAELARDLEYVSGIGSAATLLGRLLEVAEIRLQAWPERAALTSETAGMGG
ncbi:MAG: DUF115 domain-containing protein [Planctomycetes bacterium]|nr:DUF115 domain-containing protein [Planctomycetota bacterium]